jgi:RecA-family ATPase
MKQLSWLKEWKLTMVQPKKLASEETIEEHLEELQKQGKPIHKIGLPKGLPDCTDKGRVKAHSWMVSVNEWLSIQPKETRWLIPEWLPAESIVLLSGQSKYTRKTTLALHMAYAAATGGTFLGEQATQKSRVLYILEEGSWPGTHERLQAVSLTHDTTDTLFLSFKNGLKLDDEDGYWDRLLRKTINERGIACIFIDAFTYVKLGDENNVREMRPCMDVLQTIQNMGCAVVVITHLRKGVGKSLGEDPSEDIRGSSVLRDIFDLHIALRATAKSKSINCKVINRWGAPRDDCKIGWAIEQDEDRLVSCWPELED